MGVMVSTRFSFAISALLCAFALNCFSKDDTSQIPAEAASPLSDDKNSQ